LKKKLEEKELELMTLKWTTQRNHLANFQKTQTKPCIYYKPSDKTQGNTATTTTDTTNKEEKKEVKEEEKESKGRGHGRHSRSRSGSRSQSRSKSPDIKKEPEAMVTEEK